MLKRKHITAPRTFDPGPGHPRERLIYANEAEIEMLRVLTDGAASRGPKGIPSFAVTSGTTSGTTMGGNKTSSNPSGGGPGGPFGPNSGPSKSTTTSGSKSSSVTGGGGKGSSTAGAASSGSKGPVGPNGPNSGPSTGKTAGGVSAPSATSGLGGSKSPSATSAKAPSTPSSPMGGQGGLSKSQVDAYKGYGASRAANPGSPVGPVSPMGGQHSSYSTPSRAAEANARTASAIKGGMNPSGSQKVASGVSQSQKDAYTQFGQKMAAAPRAPEVMRSPGDAEQLARMARAENNLIRDPVTGKMSQLAAQGTMNVIRNRMENQNFDVRGIISQDDQFSPWEDGSYAATKPSAAETAMAEQVLRGVTPDYTATPAYPQGADFYHNATTVNKNSGYTKASATTKERIKDRFAPTLSVADAVKPGVYGHTYGVDPTGRPASPGKSVPMGAPKKPGQTNYGPGGTPLSGNLPTPSLPSGAMSADPNWGRMGLDTPTPPAASSVGGRFGGMRPNFDSPAQKISYDDISQYPASSPEAARFATAYQPDRWEQDVGFLAGRTIAPTREEAAHPGYANPYSAVDPRLIEGAAAMIRDAEAATGARATINDAYRSEWHQGLGSPARPGKKASPGKSWHQAGTAIDIGAGPVQDYLNRNRASLDQYGMVKPESMMNPANPDYPHFQVANTPRPFASGVKSGLRPPGGYMVASAVTPEPGPLTGMMNSYKAPEVSPSIYNGLKALPGAISGLGQGIRNLSETISTPNPTFKGFAGSITSPNPIVSAGAKLIGGQVIGPMVKEAAASAISGLKNTFDPNNPRAQEAEAERRSGGSSSTTKKSGPTASGVREAQRGEQREGSKTASATKGGRNPERGKGGDGESNRQSVKKETPAQRAKRIGKKKIEDLTKPEPKAADWSSYTNVMTREQALRKLLGEEWYA